MIILKIIVFIWAVCSILLSLFLLFSYYHVGIEGLKKSDLLCMQLIAPYLVVYVIKEVITIIKERRKRK